MATTKTRDKQPGEKGDRDLLERFLVSVENFTINISGECEKAAGDGDPRLLIQSTAESVIGQTRKLTVFIRQTSERIPPTQRVELDRFLQVQDGEAFAARAVEGTRQALARGGGVVGNLVQWISQHFKELKKLLKEILHFLFDLLHIPFPDWLDKIIQILDEFLDLLLSLLADVFGLDLRSTARQLSEQEVDFLREMAAFEAVRVVRSGKRMASQDET